MNIPFISNLSFWRTNKLPVLLQTEAAECGLACLCMIAGYWGSRIDISRMRTRFSVSMKGMTLKGMINMAQGLALNTRPLKLDMEHLHDLKLPCIVHWDLNHFVVLKSIHVNYAHIHDPAVGERKVILKEFAKHFTGIALEISPGSDFKKEEDIQKFSLLSLMGRIVGLKRGLLQLFTLAIALQICALIAPFYMQWLVDEALLSSDRDLITVLGCGFIFLVLIQVSIGAVRSWITTVLSTNLNLQWFNNAFSHLLKLPLPYFEKRHTGDIVSRFNSIQTIQRSLTIQFVEGAIDGVLVIATLAMMMLYSLKLTAITCIAVSLYILLRWSVFHALRDATAEQIIHAAKQQTHFLESVRGIQSVRLFGSEEERRGGWMNALADQFNADLRISKLSISYQTANTLIFGLERVIVIWMAGLAVIDNQFSIGMLYAFISYKDQFSQRMGSLVDKLFEFRMLKLHGSRVADIVLTPVESNTSDTEIDINNIDPTIELRNLSFRYADSEPEVFSGLNLVIPAGEFIAITGPSGCGKTTLLKVLLGLLEPTQGEILVGGIKLSNLGMRNYRQLLGTVMQDDTLFAGSISENITFFSSMPDDIKIQTCAHMAAVHNEISSMPMNFNTLIGDIGSGISGGQKQRILLARALYRNPKFLILDEATSHLDVWSEKAVNTAIQKIPLTRLIVAHRPETISMAQRVVVLQNGKIVRDIRQDGKTSAAA